MLTVRRTTIYGKALFISILIFLFLAGTFFYIENSRNQSLLVQEMTNKAERLFDHLQTSIEEKKNHLMIIANSWKQQEVDDRDHQFTLLAREKVNVFPSFRFIHFLDTDLVIRSSVPHEMAESIGLIGKDTSQDPINVKMLDTLMEDKEPLVSPLIWREVTEIYSAHLWVPILEGSALLGIISGDLDLSYIISEKILAMNMSDHPLFIKANDTEILRTDHRQTYSVEITREISDIPWTMGVDIEHQIPWSMGFFAGLFLSLLVSFLMYRLLMEKKMLERTKGELQEREEKLSALFTAMEEMVVTHELVYDSSGQAVDYRITDCNVAFTKITGIAQADAIGKLATELYGTTPPPYFDQYVQVVTTGEALTFETYYAPLDTHLSISVVSPGENTFATISTDITHRKKMEEELTKSEERYRKIFDFSPVGIMIADETATILEVNKAMCEISEFAREELEGHSILETLVRPEHLEASKKHIDQILSGEDLEFVIESNNARGELRYTQLHETRLVLSDGRKGILSMQIDYTDRVKAQEALQKSEEKHRRLFETMEQGVIYQDMVGNIISVNPAAERILGLSIEEMKHKTSLDPHWQMIEEDGTTVPGADHPAMMALRTGKKVGPVTRGVYHPGKHSHVWLSIIAIPLFQPGQKRPFQAYATFTDITERKEAEERIRYISFHDSLTGLYNRHFIEVEMERLDTERQIPISIIMVDLNGLKLINDTYGHGTGDEMLKSLATILQESCRKEELIARWGGDEFLVVLPQTTKEEVELVCQRVYDTCQKTFVEDIPISIAMGTAVKETMDTTLSSVLNEAEDAMYKSKLGESRSARSSVLNALLKVLEAKSFETEAHSLRMKEVALQIGMCLNLSETELNRLTLLTTLHDIGKVNISEEILTKQEPLTPEEWEVIKRHPEIGYRIARATEEFAHVAEDILSHHERWDGSGYPRGLQGKDIPLLARIVCIADAFEVMSSGRPYKKAMTKEEIIEEFTRCAGSQFDPELVEIFLSVVYTML